MGAAKSPNRVLHYEDSFKARAVQLSKVPGVRVKIEAIYRGSRSTYGSPRIHEALKGAGMAIGRNRVARLMRSRRIKARCARIYRRNPGRNDFYTGVPNRSLDRAYVSPNQVWLGDITYLRVGQAWRYLAVVLDKCSRKVLGWRLGREKSAALTGAAFDCAVRRRRPPSGVVFHTDRGIEYGAYDFRSRLARSGFIQSMNRPGTLNDNAWMESRADRIKWTPGPNRRCRMGVAKSPKWILRYGDEFKAQVIQLSLVPGFKSMMRLNLWACPLQLSATFPPMPERSVAS